MAFTPHFYILKNQPYNIKRLQFAKLFQCWSDIQKSIQPHQRRESPPSHFIFKNRDPTTKDNPSDLVACSAAPPHWPSSLSLHHPRSTPPLILNHLFRAPGLIGVPVGPRRWTTAATRPSAARGPSRATRRASS